MTKLEQDILKYNKAYREGNALISDNEYDALLEQLKKENPNSSLLRKAIIEENENSSREEELPRPMYSLEKIKDVKELRRFITDVWDLKKGDQIVVTPKYDGISILVDEKMLDVWTRGDGEKGFKSNDHYELTNNGESQNPGIFHYTFGEMIFSNKAFLEHKGSYKSARNCIAGLFNADFPDDMLRYATFVRYGSFNEDLNKDEQLLKMSHIFKNVSPYTVFCIEDFMKDSDEAFLAVLNGLFELNATYKCDGLVIEVNNAKKRKELGRLPNMNPRYAIAFKNPEWSERSATIVKDIEWNVSKDGKAKPVLIFDPIDLCGATVERATAHNAAYIVDNHIHVGAEIIIARSGDVIPKHIETIKWNKNKWEQTMDEMIVCPSCHRPMKWDVTHTELVCTNLNCHERCVQEQVYFYSILKFDEMREKTVRKLYDEGFIDFQYIHEAPIEQLENILGPAQSKKIKNQIDNLYENGTTAAKILTAYNVFGGMFGEKTCQTIFDELSDKEIEDLKNYKAPTIRRLIEIEGVSIKIAKRFRESVPLFDVLEIIPIQWKKKKVKAAENQMIIVMTGFRDAELEKKLIEMGHVVGSSVTKKTTYLLVKDKNSTSTKMKKAQELGVTIMTKEEFCNTIL